MQAEEGGAQQSRPPCSAQPVLAGPAGAKNATGRGGKERPTPNFRRKLLYSNGARNKREGAGLAGAAIKEKNTQVEGRSARAEEVGGGEVQPAAWSRQAPPPVPLCIMGGCVPNGVCNVKRMAAAPLASFKPAAGRSQGDMRKGNVLVGGVHIYKTYFQNARQQAPALSRCRQGQPVRRGGGGAPAGGSISRAGGRRAAPPGPRWCTPPLPPGRLG